MGNTNSTLLNREEAEQALFGDAAVSVPEAVSVSKKTVAAPPPGSPTPSLSVSQRYDFDHRLSKLQQLIESDSAPESLKRVPQLSKDQQRILLRKYMHREIFTVHRGPAELPDLESAPENGEFRETYLVHRDYASSQSKNQKRLSTRPRSKSYHVQSEPATYSIDNSNDDDEIQIIGERRLTNLSHDSSNRHSLEMSESSFTSSSDRDFEPPLSPQRSPDRLDEPRGNTPVPAALQMNYQGSQQGPQLTGEQYQNSGNGDNFESLQRLEHQAQLQHHHLHVSAHNRDFSTVSGVSSFYSDTLTIPKQRARPNFHENQNQREQQKEHQNQHQHQHQYQHHQTQHHCKTYSHGSHASHGTDSSNNTATSNTSYTSRTGRRAQSEGLALAASMVRLTPDEQTLVYPSREASPDRDECAWTGSSPQLHSSGPFPQHPHHSHSHHHHSHLHSHLSHEIGGIPHLPPPLPLESERQIGNSKKEEFTQEDGFEHQNTASASSLPSMAIPSLPSMPNMPSLALGLPKRHSMPVSAPHASEADMFEIPAAPEKREKAAKLSLFQRLAHRRRSMTEKPSMPLHHDDDLSLTLSIPAIPVSARKMTSEPDDSPLVANRLTISKTRPAAPRAKSMYVAAPETTSSSHASPSAPNSAYPFQPRGNELSKHIHELSDQPWALSNVPQLSPQRSAHARGDSDTSEWTQTSSANLQRTNTVSNGTHILDVGIPPRVPEHRSATLMSSSSGGSSDDYFSIGSRSPELYAAVLSSPTQAQNQQQQQQQQSQQSHSTDIYTRKCSYRRPKLLSRRTEPTPISVATVPEMESPPVSPEDDLSYELEIEEEIAARQFMLGGYKKSSTKLQVVNWQKDAFMHSSTTLGEFSDDLHIRHHPPSVPPPMPPLQQRYRQPRIYHRKGGSDAFSFENIEPETHSHKQSRAPEVQAPTVSAAQQTYLDLISNDDLWAEQANDYFSFKN